MPRAKTTVRLADIVDEVNRRNGASTCSPECRAGWNSLLESLMMGNENYNGFNNLDANQLTGDAIGQPPGIIWGYNEQGERDNRFNQYPDDTRRVYYLKRR
jgi:hypothetical protein